MSTITEIEEAVRGLSREQLKEFRHWFAEFASDAWDREIEEDANAGKLDWLAAEALEEHRQGRTRPL